MTKDLPRESDRILTLDVLKRDLREGRGSEELFEMIKRQREEKTLSDENANAMSAFLNTCCNIGVVDWSRHPIPAEDVIDVVAPRMAIKLRYQIKTQLNKAITYLEDQIQDDEQRRKVAEILLKCTFTKTIFDNRGDCSSRIKAMIKDELFFSRIDNKRLQRRLCEVEFKAISLPKKTFVFPEVSPEEIDDFLLCRQQDPSLIADGELLRFHELAMAKSDVCEWKEKVERGDDLTFFDVASAMESANLGESSSDEEYLHKIFDRKRGELRDEVEDLCKMRNFAPISTKILGFGFLSCGLPVVAKLMRYCINNRVFDMQNRRHCSLLKAIAYKSLYTQEDDIVPLYLLNMLSTYEAAEPLYAFKVGDRVFDLFRLGSDMKNAEVCEAIFTFTNKIVRPIPLSNKPWALDAISACVGFAITDELMGQHVKRAIAKSSYREFRELAFYGADLRGLHKNISGNAKSDAAIVSLLEMCSNPYLWRGEEGKMGLAEDAVGCLGVKFVTLYTMQNWEAKEKFDAAIAEFEEMEFPKILQRNSYLRILIESMVMRGFGNKNAEKFIEKRCEEFGISDPSLIDSLKEKSRVHSEGIDCVKDRLKCDILAPVSHMAIINCGQRASPTIGIVIVPEEKLSYRSTHQAPLSSAVAKASHSSLVADAAASRSQ